MKRKQTAMTTAMLLATLGLNVALFAQEATDGFVVPLDQNFGTATAAAPSEPMGGGASNFGGIKYGLWIEATSDSAALIRNVSDGTKSGYEFDNSHLLSEANWWFWGEFHKYFLLNAEIAVWDFDKTLYQANSYAANVPDVTWGDGLQSLSSMPFSVIKNANDDEIGTFNKLGFNITTPWVQARFGYGNLKENGMSQYKGIYTVLDRWNDVGDGYTELKNGKNFSQFGDFTIDALAAFSQMRDTYGLYDYIDVKYADRAQAAITFGSTTTEKDLFFYNRTNKNALSFYAAVMPLQPLKVEGHILGYFGTNKKIGGDTAAGAGKVSWQAETWKASLMQSVAGVNANSVWGSDGTEYDDINADTFTTQIDAEKSLELSGVAFSLGLDQGITLNDSDNVQEGLWTFRTQPYTDVDLKSLLGIDIGTGLYGVWSFERLAKETSADRDLLFHMDEFGIEVVATNTVPLLQKLTFDYAIDFDYAAWENGHGLPLNKAYHSIMANADLTERLNVHAGSIVRAESTGDKTNVPFAFSLGASFKNVPLPGRPMLWAHFTYGMNPYEDNNYSLFRKDDPLNKAQHRTYLLNELDGNTTTSHISFGLIWNL